MRGWLVYIRFRSTISIVQVKLSSVIPGLKKEYTSEALRRAQPPSGVVDFAKLVVLGRWDLTAPLRATTVFRDKPLFPSLPNSDIYVCKDFPISLRWPRYSGVYCRSPYMLTVTVRRAFPQRKWAIALAVFVASWQEMLNFHLKYKPQNILSGISKTSDKCFA